MEKVEFKQKPLLPVVKKLGESRRNETVANIKYMGGGSYGKAFLLKYASGAEEVIKAFKLPSMLSAEAEALELLGKVSPLKFPKVYHVHFATDEFPLDALCMEKIAGETALSNPCFVFYPKKRRDYFTQTVINAILAIHDTTNEKFGFLSSRERFDTWQEFYKKFVSEIFEDAKTFYADSQISTKIFSLFETGIKNFDYIFSDKIERASLIHGDLHVLNIMVCKKTFAPTGIIDPFNSMWGDREYDLFQLKVLTGNRYKLYETYKNTCKTSAKIDLKVDFYALANEILCHMRSGWNSKILYAALCRRLKKEFKLHGLI